MPDDEFDIEIETDIGSTKEQFDKVRKSAEEAADAIDENDKALAGLRKQSAKFNQITREYKSLGKDVNSMEKAGIITSDNAKRLRDGMTNTLAHYIDELLVAKSDVVDYHKAEAEGNYASTQSMQYAKMILESLTGSRKKDTQAKKDDVPITERWIRRHRYMQSYLLVTGNFIQKLGNGIKAFGAIVTLMSAPIVYFLNVILIPLIPYFADLSKALMDVVSWFDEVTEGAEWIKGGLGSLFLLLSTLGASQIILNFIAKFKKIYEWFKKITTYIPTLTTALGKVATKLKSITSYLTSMPALKIAGTAAAGAAIGVLAVYLLDMVGAFDAINDAGAKFRDDFSWLWSGNHEQAGVVGWLMGALETIVQLLGDAFNLVTSLWGGSTLLTKSKMSEYIAAGTYNEDIMTALNEKYGKGNVTYSGTGGYTVNGEHINEYASGGNITSSGLAYVHEGETVVPATGTSLSGSSAATTQTFVFQGSYKDEYDMFKKFQDIMRKEGLRFST